MRIVLITLDDVSFYTLGFTGVFPNFTPNINKLSRESYTFWNAHCNIPFCEPSRAVLMTGLYPQNNGSTCFIPITKDTPCLSLILKNKGYYTILCGKNFHYKNMHWDAEFKNCEIALESALKFDDNLFFSVNLKFAHRKFVESEKISFVNFPNFLPRTTSVEEEVSDYLNTLNQADVLVGKIVKSFNKRDIIILTSDHGMSFPYFKGDCYGTSTNVPFMVRHETISPRQDKTNIISHVDFLPTMGDWLGFEGFFDGHSYYDLLENHGIRDVNYVYAQLNRMMHGPECRIRSLIKKDVCYTINIDQEFPGKFVDGWGWEKSLKEMNNDYFYRPLEQLLKYNKLNLYPSDNLKLKTEMRNQLLQLMKYFKDPQYKNAKSKFLKL